MSNPHQQRRLRVAEHQPLPGVLAAGYAHLFFTGDGRPPRLEVLRVRVRGGTVASIVVDAVLLEDACESRYLYAIDLAKWELGVLRYEGCRPPDTIYADPARYLSRVASETEDRELARAVGLLLKKRGLALPRIKPLG